MMEKGVKKWIILAGVLVVILLGIRLVIGGDEDNWICSGGKWVKHGQPNKPMPAYGCGIIKVTSPAWENKSVIPKKYTCDGGNISPPVVISGLSAGSKSWALIMTDSDAPGGNFTHWVVWNINPDVKEIAEGRVPEGTPEGKNDFGKNGYGGPCPPFGQHHYLLRVIALDQDLPIAAGVTEKEAEAAMAGHILGEGEITGVYR